MFPRIYKVIPMRLAWYFDKNGFEKAWPAGWHKAHKIAQLCEVEREFGFFKAYKYRADLLFDCWGQ